MKYNVFDDYIFLDYSDNLIGYVIIKQNQIKDLSWISKLKHYHSLKHRDLYLKAMKMIFEKNNVPGCFEKHRVSELRQNIEICSEVIEFCKSHPNEKIFISVDDRQYKGFMKLMNLLDEGRFTIVREGQLKNNSMEYRLSLIVDTLLNLRRTRQ